MDADSAGPSKAKTKKLMNQMQEGPLTVLDQALKDAERYPGCSDYLSALLVAVPTNMRHPCKICCGFNRADGTFSENFSKYTPVEIENMANWCSIHVDDREAPERTKARAALEAKVAKKLKQEKEKRWKNEQLVAAKKEQRMKNYRGKSKKKNARAKFLEEPVKIEVSEEDIDEYMYEEVMLKKKKKTVWLCPECKKSAKYGSVECTGCGEWYHFACAGFMRQKDIPIHFKCQICDF